MGCFQSKHAETTELHPNFYRVVNIGENGVDLCTCQLEITESDIILYREGRDTTIWPLHSLRRYGFEGDVFSFESGRRCETGEGIYAFRCRRASLLFRFLQQQIQLRNVIQETVSYPVSRLSPSPQARQTLQASVVHRSSVDNGQPAVNNNIPTISQATSLRPVALAPRSPSSADILEVTPLYPLPQVNTNQITNVYQVKEFKREHNNNQTERTTEATQRNDINKDLAALRQTLRQEAAMNTIRDIEDETRFLEGRYINTNMINNQEVSSLLSPTLSNNSEQYAQLNVEQESARLYMNVGANIANVITSVEETTVETPIIFKPVEYCNTNIGNRAELNTYANLSLSDKGDSGKSGKVMLNYNAISDNSQKFSESDTFTSFSPVEELEVNYAILDIDNKQVFSDSPESNNYTLIDNTSSGSLQRHNEMKPQSSVDKNITLTTTTIGYSTIDFDKTKALTYVASETDADTIRGIRHNSLSITCGSPGTGTK